MLANQMLPPKRKWANKISAMGTSDKTTQIWGHIAPPPPTPITKSGLKTSAKLKNMFTHVIFACSLIVVMRLLHAWNPARFNFLLKRRPTIPFPKFFNGLFFTCYTCLATLVRPPRTSTHQRTIRWIPVITQLWMDLIWVKIWFHLSNQFCRK